MAQPDLGAIAVAGGTGFLGRHLVARLRERGYRVVVLARGNTGAGSRGDSEGVELRACDLARAITPELLTGCLALVNLVGIKRPRADLDFEAAHVSIPVALADAAEAAGLAQMIHISVAGTDRRDVDAYAYLETKLRGEQALRDRGGGLPITIVRPGVVYGRGDDMLRNLADSNPRRPAGPGPSRRSSRARADRRRGRGRGDRALYRAASGPR